MYVPRLYDEESSIDSEKVFQLTDQQLNERCAALSVESYEEYDKKERASIVLREELARLSESGFKRVLLKHWADFDFATEAKQLTNANLRTSLLRTIEDVASVNTETQMEELQIESTVRNELIDRLVGTAARFETRATTFRDVHPLSLQVIVRSGVVNGILVTRSVHDCARLLRGVIENSLDFDVVVDESNYRLVERVTRSTLRVVSRHRLLTFAFWSQYFEDTSLSIPQHELPVATL